MSLMEAMLNEGYRDPCDVYIALRTDGALGSGTIDDPYDGSSRVLPGETASLTLNRRRIRVSTAPKAHGYSGNPEIVITGVVIGPDTAIYNRTFHVEEILSATEFTLLLNAPPRAVPWWEDTVECQATPSGTKFPITISWPWAEIVSSSSLRFSDGDIFRISSAADAAFNGTFVLHYLAGNPSGTVARFRLDAAADADVTTPINVTAEKLIYGFDSVMRSLPEKAAVHLGPGVFETRGYSYVDPSWQPKRGQNISGSGMGVTTLKLVGARHAAVGGFGAITHAIGCDYYPYLDDLALSDFTIDCNLPGQTAPKGKDFAQVLCGAITVAGSYQRVRRVRALHYGTQNPHLECFGIGVAGQHPALEQPANCVIEDCILEQPSPNNVRETSGLALLGLSPALHRGCVIRHCYVNSEYPGGISSQFVPVRPVDGIEPVSGQEPRRYRLKTSGGVPHHRTVGQNIKLNAVVMPRWTTAGFVFNEHSAAFNRSFKVHAVGPGADTLEFVLDKNPDFRLDVSTATLQRLPSGSPISILKLESADDVAAPWNYRVTTSENHNCSLNDSIRLANINIPQIAGGDHVLVSSTVFNGDFTAIEVNAASPKVLRFAISRPPDGYLHLYATAIGVPFQAMGANGGTGGIAECNRVLHTRVGHYHDTATSRDVTVRENYYHDVSYCNYWLMGFKVPLESAIEGTISRSDTTITFASPEENRHGLSAGDIVQISGVKVGGTESNPYNGYFEIKEVPEIPNYQGKPTSFKYEMIPAPAVNPDAPLAKYNEFFRYHQISAEANVYGLSPSLASDGAVSWGVLLGDSRSEGPPPRPYRRSVIKNNVVHQLSGPTDVGCYGYGIGSCENAVIENNVAFITQQKGIRQWWSKGKYFHNQNEDAELAAAVPGNGAFGQIDELQTVLQDALLLGIM